MTEDEWLRSTNPQPMIRFLLGTHVPRVQDIESFPDCIGSPRKLRLFACACYHRIRCLLPDPRAARAVEVAEQFADGMTTADEIKEIAKQIWKDLWELEPQWRASQGSERQQLLPTHAALALASQILHPEAPKAAYYASSNAYLHYAEMKVPGVVPHDRKFTAAQQTEEQAQAQLLRCIFGLSPEIPYATPLCWLTTPVGSVAHRIYEERCFEELPILADALEEAGCFNEDMLNHCRMDKIHDRGCWVVDLVLGRG